MSEKLEEVPNIGPVLADRLRRSGIDDAVHLRTLGDAEAFARLVAHYPEDACTHTRLALAGAVRGVRWQGLPAELRAELASGLKR